MQGGRQYHTKNKKREFTKLILSGSYFHIAINISIIEKLKAILVYPVVMLRTMKN